MTEENTEARDFSDKFAKEVIFDLFFALDMLIGIVLHSIFGWPAFIWIVAYLGVEAASVYNRIHKFRRGLL